MKPISTKIKPKGNPYAFHPFLIAIYPTLSLLAHNIQEIRLSEGYRAILISVISTIIIFLLFRVAFKNWQKAALATSLLLFLFFSYGHAYLSLKGMSFIGINLGRHRFLVLIFLGIAFIGIYLSARIRESLGLSTKALNIIGTVMIAMPLIVIIDYSVKSGFDLVSGSLEVKDKDHRTP